MLKLNRIFVTTKDVMTLTGTGEATSRKLIKKIRNHYQKEAHHAITFDEFYRYHGIPKPPTGNPDNFKPIR
ncbi:hypothetical protein [Pustulibacterium marinum]|uniref:hypothetical protein n=1 Tax=Pustulibacterium marinum TaxID=1224947 RepID=UPI000B80EBA0|nr:hypothetical protein [Pustulibacterium marinum]